MVGNIDGSKPEALYEYGDQQTQSSSEHNLKTQSSAGAFDGSLLALGSAQAAQPTLSITNSLQLWLKADAGVVTLKADAGVTASASGTVTAWKDQSTNHNDAAQADETMAPKLTAKAVNNQPALTYDGSQQYP